jgi:hypothetical protein
MKKLWILFGVCMVVGISLADWIYHDTVRASYTVNTAWTNLAYNAVRLTALDSRFTASSSGTLTVSRIRNSVTNVIKSHDFTSATSLFLSFEEFEGLMLKKDDILLIEDDTGAGVTNTVIINLESSR